MRTAGTRPSRRPVEPPVVPPLVRSPPPPLRGGLLTFLRFARANHMLSSGYFVLIMRWLWLKLRWRGRLETDGLCFVCPGVKFEIGRDAKRHARALVLARPRLQGARPRGPCLDRRQVGARPGVHDLGLPARLDRSRVHHRRPRDDDRLRSRDRRGRAPDPGAGDLQARRQRRPQRLDRLRRLRAARRHGRRQLGDRHECGRHL